MEQLQAKQFLSMLFTQAQELTQLTDLESGLEFLHTCWHSAEPQLPLAHISLNLSELEGSPLDEFYHMVLERLAPNSLLSRGLVALYGLGGLSLLPQIATLGPTYVRELKGEQQVEVFSAEELTPEVTQRIKKSLKLLIPQPFFVTYHVNPWLLAGIAIRSKNFELDDTLRGRITEISKDLKQELRKWLV